MPARIHRDLETVLISQLPFPLQLQLPALAPAQVIANGNFEATDLQGGTYSENVEVSFFSLLGRFRSPQS